MYVRCAPERIVMARGAAMGGARVRGWVHCPGCQVKSSLQQQQLRDIWVDTPFRSQDAAVSLERVLSPSFVNRL